MSAKTAAKPAAPDVTRRHWLGRALGWAPWLLTGCAAPFPESPPGDGSSSARRHLQAAAHTQGLGACQDLGDVNVTLSDTWWPSTAGQPATGRGASPSPLSLRLLPGLGVLALSHEVPDTRGSGRLQVLRDQRRDQLQLWRAGRRVDNTAARNAAAVAADLHRLLLLGAIALAEHPGPVNWAEPVTLDNRRCDHLHLLLQPGLGGGASARVSLFIDREQGWLRRLRVSLVGLGNGADLPLEVDLAGHRRLHGVLWPSRWTATVPGALPGRAPMTWQLAGLDANRGYAAIDLASAPWTGRAAGLPAPLLPP